MISDIRLLDDSTRPPAPELPELTLQQRLPGKHLEMIHDHYRENMRTISRLIHKAMDGEISPEALKAEAEASPIMVNYRQFGAVCGQHCRMIEVHHTIEDQAIFPQLSEKSLAFKKVIDRLAREHDVVHDLLERLISVLAQLINEPSRGLFDEAVEIYQLFEKVLLSHFGYEEESIGGALGYFGIQM